MKEILLSELPVLISSTHAKRSSSPSFGCYLGAGGTAAADTEEQSHSPASVFWPAQQQSCQVMRISVSVFVVLSLCTRLHVCTHTYPGRLNVHSHKPFSQLQHIRPISDGSQIQNGQSYFKLLVLKMVTHRNDWSALSLPNTDRAIC